jgi:hypothetical protein
VPLRFTVLAKTSRTPAPSIVTTLWRSGGVHAERSENRIGPYPLSLSSTVFSAFNSTCITSQWSWLLDCGAP